MALPSVWWLRKAADAFSSLNPILGLLVALCVWTFNIVEFVIMAGFTYIVGALNSIDTSAFRSANLATIEWIGYVNALFPLAESLAILGAYVSAWLTVILIRWVKSVFPTLSN